MEQQEIPNDTPIKLNLPAGYVVFLLGVLDKVSLPREQTNGPHDMITKQYQDQFKEAFKKLEKK